MTLTVNIAIIRCRSFCYRGLLFLICDTLEIDNFSLTLTKGPFLCKSLFPSILVIFWPKVNFSVTSVFPFFGLYRLPDLLKNMFNFFFFSVSAILQVISISANMIAMWGKEAQLYLAVNREGKVYATVSLLLFKHLYCLFRKTVSHHIFLNNSSIRRQKVVIVFSLKVSHRISSTLTKVFIPSTRILHLLTSLLSQCILGNLFGFREMSQMHRPSIGTSRMLNDPPKTIVLCEGYFEDRLDENEREMQIKETKTCFESTWNFCIELFSISGRL